MIVQPEYHHLDNVELILRDLGGTWGHNQAFKSITKSSKSNKIFKIGYLYYQTPGVYGKCL